MFKKIIVIFFLGIGITLFAQNIERDFVNFSIEQGLSQSTIYSLYQDEVGFIWVGTQNALNRYDGYNFKIFDTFRDGNKVVTRTYINTIVPQKINGSEILWLGTQDGLVAFNPTNNKSKIYQLDKNNEASLSNNTINAILLDEGYLWIGTNGGGLNKFDLKTKSFQRFNHIIDESNSISSDFIQSIFKSAEGNLWIGTDGGYLNKFNKITNSFNKYKIVSDDDIVYNENNIYQIFQDKNKNLVLATDFGVKLFDPIKQKLINNNFFASKLGKFINFPVNVILKNKEKYYLGTSNSGLIVIDESSNNLINFKNNPNNAKSISGDVISSMLIDKKNNLWIGTKTGGLNYYNPNNSKFNTIKNNQYSNLQIPAFSIYSVIVQEDKLWIGTVDGISIIDLEDLNSNYGLELNSKSHLVGNRISDLIYDEKNKIVWIAANSGLYSFNLRSKKWENYSHDSENNSTISSNNVYSLFLDSKNNLWVGTVGSGLNKFNRKDKSFKRYYSDKENAFSVKGYRIYSFFEDSRGTIYVCTDNGLSKYNKNEDNFFTYQNDPKDSTSIIHNVVRSLLEDSKGRIWIGTSIGLCLFNRDTESFLNIKNVPRIPEDWIYSIREDANGNIWFTTNSGMYKMNYENKILKRYTIHDGLPSNEFNLASFVDENGMMYFGGIKGLTYFKPEEIVDDEELPSIVIVDFKLFNKSIKVGDKLSENFSFEKSITQLKSIELNYQQNVFSFEFVALNFIPRDENQYAYKLEGFENKWNYVGDRNYATYTNLHEGEYKFKVKAANKDGIWNEEGVSIDITITPPFYRTSWFIIISILFVLSITFGFYKYRTRLLKIKANLLQQKISEKTSDLLKLNSDLKQEIIQREKIQKELHDNKEKYRYLVENINDVIFSIIQKKKITYISPAIYNILGYVPDEIKSKELAMFFEPDDWKIFESRFSNHKSDEPITGEYRMISKDGEVLWMRISEKPIIKDGLLCGSQGVLTNITEKKLLESQLVQAQKLESIGQLAAGIAHEINTPIQFVGDNTQFLSDSFDSIFEIIGMYTALIDSIQKGEKYEEIIDGIYEAKDELDYEYLSEEIPVAIQQTMEGVGRVAQIVRAMKDFSHPGVEEKVNTDINRSIESTVIVSRNEWKYVADIEENYEKDLPVVPCLPGQFNQVILNMIINSAHAISDASENGKKGKIKISTQSSLKGIEIRINDNGKGIPDSIKHKIFDPFFTTKDVGKGTGQGLSIAHDIIVNKHNGSIDVESKENEGTTFILTLPYEEQNMETEAIKNSDLDFKTE